MATVKVCAGVCGFITTIYTESEDMQEVAIKIESDCSHIMAMGSELDKVDGYQECFAQIGDGEVYKIARKCCKHAACPVPSAIIKAIEVACGLALPRDVEFKICG